MTLFKNQTVCGDTVPYLALKYSMSSGLKFIT